MAVGLSLSLGSNIPPSLLCLRVEGSVSNPSLVSTIEKRTPTECYRFTQ